MTGTTWRYYGITTADRPERLEHLSKEFRRFGLDHSILVATRPDSAHGFPSIGYRGCFESHLASLRQARQDGVDVAVLVEDDVAVVRSFLKLLATVRVELEGIDWSMLYLGYLDRTSPCRDEELHHVTDHVARSAGWEVYGAHFVAVRATAFDALIANFETRLLDGGHRISPDGVLNEFRRDEALDTLLCLPNLARQAPSPSGITARAGVRTKLLGRKRIRAVVEIGKRLKWDLEAHVPPSVARTRWNRRARRAQRR